MKECAFCDHQGKLSAEHIASDWMRDLFPGRRTGWFKNDKMEEPKHFEADSIDWTAKVVCESCNNGWMSDIESQHAKPALTPLITGQFDVPIDRTRAHSMALFAFKTAVILDHQQRRDSGPFFSKRIRYAFREHRTIPGMVNMWFCGYKGHRGNGQFKTAYMKGEVSPSDHFLMYVCTCAIGNFVFQVLAVKQIGNFRFRPRGGFEGLGVPFWPEVPRDFVWPPRYALDGIPQFEAFSDRWRTVDRIR
jgi:hypothetical protein